jgi:hypothetical protein
MGVTLLFVTHPNFVVVCLVPSKSGFAAFFAFLFGWRNGLAPLSVLHSRSMEPLSAVALMFYSHTIYINKNSFILFDYLV